jgi:hypothetical protein
MSGPKLALGRPQRVALRRVGARGWHRRILIEHEDELRLAGRRRRGRGLVESLLAAALNLLDPGHKRGELIGQLPPALIVDPTAAWLRRASLALKPPAPAAADT